MHLELISLFNPCGVTTWDGCNRQNDSFKERDDLLPGESYFDLCLATLSYFLYFCGSVCCQKSSGREGALRHHPWILPFCQRNAHPFLSQLPSYGLAAATPLPWTDFSITLCPLLSTKKERASLWSLASLSDRPLLICPGCSPVRMGRDHGKPHKCNLWVIQNDR